MGSPSIELICQICVAIRPPVYPVCLTVVAAPLPQCPCPLKLAGRVWVHRCWPSLWQALPPSSQKRTAPAALPTYVSWPQHSEGVHCSGQDSHQFACSSKTLFRGSRDTGGRSCIQKFCFCHVTRATASCLCMYLEVLTTPRQPR